MSKNEVVMNPRKVAVVGCGFVGSASAFCTDAKWPVSEMVLIDANFEKAEGEPLIYLMEFHLHGQ